MSVSEDADSSQLAGTRILMLAPEPVLRPRGTPLSIAARLRALAALGCRVDLITYPFGETLDLPGLSVWRSGRWPVRGEPPVGPSVAKVVLDGRLARLACRRLEIQAYDLIHTHEEAAFIGALLARRHRLPHLYEMHSSLPEQMVAYNWFRSGGWAFRMARRAERWLLRWCDAVIVVYPSQAEAARRASPRTPVVLIENPPLPWTLGLPPFPAETPTGVGHRSLVNRCRGDDAGCKQPVPRGPEGGVAATPSSRGASEDAPGPSVPGRILYAGNLAANQGIDVLLAALARVVCGTGCLSTGAQKTHGLRATRATVHLVVMGGRPAAVRRARETVRKLGVADRVQFLGVRSPAETWAAHRAAAVFVSPRLGGQNVPSKVYTYLAAGRPIVATDVPAHTQILDETCAILVPPTAEGLAAGLVRALTDEVAAGRLAAAGRARLARHFTPVGYVAAVARALRLALRPPGPLNPGRASPPVRSGC